MSVCDPTMTKLLVRTAFGPPGLAMTADTKRSVILVLSRFHLETAFVNSRRKSQQFSQTFEL